MKDIKNFFRKLKKNKLYSSITIFGFAISLMFVILLSVYVQKQYSYDEFHENKDRIYRLVHDSHSGFACPSGPLLMDTYPEIESFTRMFKRGGYASVKSNKSIGINYLMGDSSFFNIFSFELIKGNTNTALIEKSSIVLTETYALKLFGQLPEIGQIVKLDGKWDYKIGGIMKDMPENTHFQNVDGIVDFPSLAMQWSYPKLLTTYNNNSFGLYVMEKESADFSKRAPDILKQFTEVNWMYKRGYADQVIFEPITDSYFSSSTSSGTKHNSKRVISVVTAIVIMILVLSILNYINLTIAQSATRSKEVAIKKLMGSRKWRILVQYIYESILITFLSYCIAIVLCLLSESFFNHLFNTKIELFRSLNWQFLWLSITAIVIIGSISGLIPALSISNFNTVEVIKGAFRMKNRGIYSKALISFQYLIIIVLVISALVINKQTSFLRSYDLGFDKSNILSITNKIKPKKQTAFKSLLMNIPGVEKVCFVRGNPIDAGNNNSFNYNGIPLSFQTFDVDTSYFSMMGMEVDYTGVAYSKDAVLLNETAVKVMELGSSPTSVKLYGDERPLYGIVKDYHFENLKEKVGPAYFQILPSNHLAWSIEIKISNKNILETVNQIKVAYDDFTHGIPLNMTFLDKEINNWYKQEEKIGEIVKYFSILTIVIAVMGLFAMSLYYVQQKTKEIGVRKVNGAKISEVLVMLNQEFVTWVSIAFVFACPIAYYALNIWLNGFAYKTSISWWIYAVAALFAMFTALFTVSWQCWRAATRNPVEALRYE